MIKHISDRLPVYIGTFFISVAILSFEVFLVRMFSIIQWYHFASMVVSIALFGFAASGTFTHIFSKIFAGIETEVLITTCSIFFAFSTPITFVLTNGITFDPYWKTFNLITFLKLFGYYILLGIPFFFAGLILCIIFARMPEDASRIYFFNMSGSGLGCFLTLFLIPLFKYETSMIIGAIALAGAILFSLRLSARARILTIFCFIIFILFMNIPFPQIQLSQWKKLSMIQKAIGSQIIETRWGTTSRIDLVKSPFVRFAPGLSPRCKKIPPDQLGLIIDGDRMDVVTKYEPEIRKFVNRLPLSIVYQIKKGGSSLIIEGGGGLALVVALSNNMHEIFVVEPEYQILQIVKEKLAEFSGRIYNRLKVKALDVDARTFLKSTDKKFDVIDIALRESIFAVTSGISGLSENYLFTKEAFEQYIKHLKPGGILSLTRWIIYPPRESIRMFTTAYHALKSTGTKVPESHMFMFRSSTTYTLLVKKEPFSLHEIQQINTLLKDNNYQPIWYTGFTKDKVEKFSREYYSVIDAFLRAQDKKKFFLAYPFNVSPIFDNKPFLTNYFRWERLGELERETGMQWEPFFEGAFVIMFVLAQSIILSFVFIFLPMFFHRRVAKGKKLITGLTYFFLIGIGFMLVEIPLLQFFILFLGHPVYAFSVVILSLLVFAGIGSFASNYFVNRIKLLIIAGFVILTCFIIAGIFILPKVLANIGIISLVARFLISIILLAPLGLFMGFPFPTGIRIMGALNREAIPWAWCLNGCASVIGAVLANWLAINFGFSTVLFSGCLAYLLAFACIYRLCHLYAKSTSQTA